MGLAWMFVYERFTPPKQDRRGKSMFSSLRLLTPSSGLLSLFFVLLMAQFGVRTVQPVVTLYVQQLVTGNQAERRDTGGSRVLGDRGGGSAGLAVPWEAQRPDRATGGCC